MRNAAQVLDRAVVEEVPHLLTEANAPSFLAQADVVGKLLLQFVPLSVAIRLIHWPLRYRVRLRLVHQVSDPGSNWLDHYLRALALQEIKHVEVAIALGDLRPELTRDLYQRLYLGAINFDRIHLFAGGVQCIQIILAPHVLVPLAENVCHVAQNFVALKLELGPLWRPLLDLK